ncbi:MAG: glycosyltransferase family protein [Rhodospirillales bacterium]|nr:glycosyltransferase family protein [Rhodospirillales bacterium]
MTVAVIVQARMGSSRLPGKVLEQVGDTTVLSEVLQRCKAVPAIDVVCCAVADGRENDQVEALATRNDCIVFRGSETDVLGRYLGAARHVGADVVLRVTSDCPLIDPHVCGAVLALVGNENYDYATNNMPPSWPHGLDCEAFTTSWLETAGMKANDPEEREHVTPFIRRHPSVRRANLLCPKEGLKDRRWTLDTPEDLRHLRNIFTQLPVGAERFSYLTSLAIDEGGILGGNNAGVQNKTRRTGSYLPDNLDHDVAQFHYSHDHQGLAYLRV